MTFADASPAKLRTFGPALGQATSAMKALPGSVAAAAKTSSGTANRP